MIYVYVITEAPVAPPRDELRAVDAGALAAVVRDVDAAPEADPAQMLAHEAVVEEIMAVQPVLPVRFGTVFDAEPEVVSLLESREPDLLRLLGEVRGCVELSVRMRWRPETPASGADWLDQRRRADEAHRPLAERARASTTRSEPGLLAAAYLVPAADVTPFTGRVAAVRDEHPELDFSCTGPWPPYSFV
jgi:hypothetical protein